MSVSSSWITQHYLTRQPIKAVSSTTSLLYQHICYKYHFVIHNKSAKLTQNTAVVFVVNSILMTTFWEQDIRLGEQIPLIQFLDNSRAIIQECLGDLAGYRTWSRYYAK